MKYSENNVNFIVNKTEATFDVYAGKDIRNVSEDYEYFLDTSDKSRLAFLDSDKDAVFAFEKDSDNLIYLEHGIIVPDFISKSKMAHDKYVFSDNCFDVVTLYDESDTGEIRTYQNCVMVKFYTQLPDGERVTTYSNEPGPQKKMYYEKRGNNITEFKMSTERCFNKAGFLEYEREYPDIDDEPGSYIEIVVEIISEPDEIFKKYCAGR